MPAKINSKYTTVLLHVFIWSLLLSLPHFFFDSRNSSPGALPSSFYFVTNLYHIGLFYFNAFFLYPLFFNRKRWWAFLLSIAVILFFSYYLKLFIISQWYPHVIFDELLHRILFFPPVPFLVISTLYRFIVNKNERDKKQKEIETAQLAMKLKFLRSQISPHFIFNVLTNLVSLARKRSEQLEPQLIKLSELMRYILYESDEKKVSLSKELEYLRSYIDLQEMRFGEDVAIDLDVQIPEAELQRNIEPMLLIPFVENAFKHGIGIDQPFIEIRLESQEGVLKFEVRNKFNRGEETKDMSPGIGLENVQSRLTILYPKEHSLVIKKENNLFTIYLTLKLR
jgi:two-component system LytT family sensor kinase